MEIKPFLDAKEFCDKFTTINPNCNAECIEFDHDSALKVFKDLNSKGIKVPGEIMFFSNVGKGHKLEDKLNEELKKCHYGFHTGAGMFRYYAARDTFSPAILDIADIFDMDKIQEICKTINEVMGPRKYWIKCHSINLNNSLFTNFNYFEGRIGTLGGLDMYKDEQHWNKNSITCRTKYKELIKVD